MKVTFYQQKHRSQSIDQIHMLLFISVQYRIRTYALTDEHSILDLISLFSSLFMQSCRNWIH
jgi:hypothetical protein